MPSRITPSAAIEANRYTSFTVLGIVATVFILTDSLERAVRKLSNKRNIPLWKKYAIIDFSSLKMLLNTDKITFRILLPEYTRKHDPISGNLDQRINL